MFWLFIRIRALLRLGLGRPFKFVTVILFTGCIIAGLIYAVVVFRAVNERSGSSHVHAHSTH